MAKTDWQMGDTVQPEDLNQIGQEINDNAADLLDHKSAAVLDHPDGSVTTEKLADGAVTASKVAADVAKTADLAAHANTTSGAHGATSAATPNTIVQRDPVGRFKAAAPAAADDVARLAEVMAAESSIENTLLPTLQSVKTKTDLIGTTGDGTSTASLFGRLAAVKGKTDLIGTVSDASGTASVFGKFADIKAKTDLIGSTSDGTSAGTVFGKFATIKAKTDLIGSTSDAAGTTTVFGRLADVKAKTDLIGATGDSSSASTVFGRLAAVKTKTDLIGATGDSSSTATVFGRLAAIKAKTDLINNGSNSLELKWSSSIKPYNVAYLSTNGSNTLETLLNITGKGVMRNLAVVLGPASKSIVLRITVDGVVVSGNLAFWANATSSTDSGGWFVIGTGNSSPNVFANIRFNNSLKIEVDEGTWSGSSHTVIYTLEP